MVRWKQGYLSYPNAPEAGPPDPRASLLAMHDPTPQPKNDLYRRRRGGTSVFLDLSCAACGTAVMLYQKDGKGSLQRCYLNRIFRPPELEQLQHLGTTSPSQLSSLVCSGCGALLGVPMRHADGRLAFRLARGALKKVKHTG